ncbi:hypothetical protein D3C71_1919210 [compost metagenome]
MQQHEEVRARGALAVRHGPGLKPAGHGPLQRGIQLRVGQGFEQVQVAQQRVAKGRRHRGAPLEGVVQISTA